MVGGRRSLVPRRELGRAARMITVRRVNRILAGAETRTDTCNRVRYLGHRGRADTRREEDCPACLHTPKQGGSTLCGVSVCFNAGLRPDPLLAD